MASTDELTEAIRASADELRQVIDGIVAAAPDSPVLDRVVQLNAITRAANICKSRAVKRRMLPGRPTGERRRSA